MVDGGWTRFLRRESGAVDFDRLWGDYKDGFGDVSGEHFLGNDILSQITADTSYKLHVDLSTWSGTKMAAQYSNFKVDPESSTYRVRVSGYTGDAGDMLSYHNAGGFATRDKDNSDRCAASYTGGWWFNSCFRYDTNPSGHMTLEQRRHLVNIRSLRRFKCKFRRMCPLGQ